MTDFGAKTHIIFVFYNLTLLYFWRENSNTVWKNDDSNLSKTEENRKNRVFYEINYEFCTKLTTVQLKPKTCILKICKNLEFCVPAHARLFFLCCCLFFLKEKKKTKYACKSPVATDDDDVVVIFYSWHIAASDGSWFLIILIFTLLKKTVKIVP